MHKINDEISALDEIISSGKAAADDYLRRGMLRWKSGDQAGAISDYEAAVALDPDSPAREALEMSRDIMNFYDKSRYNP